MDPEAIGPVSINGQVIEGVKSVTIETWIDGKQVVHVRPVAQMTRAQLEKEVNQLRQLVVDADAVSRARFEYYGLCDSIDNTGAPYPSQWSANLIKIARATHKPDERLNRFRG
jgi:hypothetical protein